MSISVANTRVTITLAKDLKKKLQVQADAEHRTLSNMISTILYQHITKQNN